MRDRSATVVDRRYSSVLSAHRLFRIQNELLHPPIVHIGDEYNVLGWTSEAMRPIELSGSTT